MAVVGHTGAGKTTLISLLLRFYVQKGAIRIGGVDVRQMDPRDLRRQFSVVLPVPTCSPAPWRRTSGWAGRHRPRTAVKGNLIEFIRSLPDGCEQPIRERGTGLSTAAAHQLRARAGAQPRFLVLNKKPPRAWIRRPSSAFATPWWRGAPPS